MKLRLQCYLILRDRLSPQYTCVCLSRYKNTRLLFTNINLRTSARCLRTRTGQQRLAACFLGKKTYIVIAHLHRRKRRIQATAPSKLSLFSSHPMLSCSRSVITYLIPAANNHSECLFWSCRKLLYVLRIFIVLTFLGFIENYPGVFRKRNARYDAWYFYVDFVFFSLW